MVLFPGPHARPMRALCLALAGVWGVACGRGAPVSPHAPTGPTSGAAKQAAHMANEGCTTCHAAIGAEWRASNHAEAFRHSTFQVAFAIEPLPFCTRCHAPEADAERPQPRESDLGVACVSCHAGGKRWPDLPALTTSAATPPAGDPRDAACARCHEFAFPGEGGDRARPRLMQRTASEHRASAVAGTPCVTCHMPRVAEPGGGQHVDHRFFASRSAAAVKSAAHVTARREAGLAVFTFTRAGVGHAFPTGDIFRRLRVVVESDAAKRSVTLARRSKLEADEGEAADTRPFADGRDLYVAVVPTDGLTGELRYRVVYERVSHPTSLDESSGEVDGAIEVARGLLR